MRYLYVHQRVLEESSQLLHSAFLENIIGKIDKLEKALGGNLLFSSLLQLELGYTYLLYGEVQKTKLHFEKANMNFMHFISVCLLNVHLNDFQVTQLIRFLSE